MHPIRLVLYPFRLFLNGGLRKSNRTAQGEPSPNQASTTGTNMNADSKGWPRGQLLATVTALLLTAGLFLYLTAFLESEPSFRTRFGAPGLADRLASLGLVLPDDGRAAFYRVVLARAVSSSEVALVQVLILFFVVMLGIRMLLINLGNLSAGRGSVRAWRTGAFMSMAMILLPALGILSTVIGILSTGNVSAESLRMIIFGPSGIGILGYIIATAFHGMSEYGDTH